MNSFAAGKEPAEKDFMNKVKGKSEASKIELKLKVPARFYRVLREAASAEKLSIPEKVIRELVIGLDDDLAELPGLKERLGIDRQPGERDYQPRLRRMAGLEG
jgi:hypothetical protein